MPAYSNDQREVFRLKGITHQTLAAAPDGASGLEVWRQTLEPRAQSPIHYHECEEVILVHEGSGRITIGNDVIDFDADTTLIVPAEAVHQLVNTGQAPLRITAILSATPAHAYAPDGSAIPLPWDVL